MKSLNLVNVCIFLIILTKLAFSEEQEEGDITEKRGQINKMANVSYLFTVLSPEHMKKNWRYYNSYGYNCQYAIECYIIDPNLEAINQPQGTVL